MSRDVVEAFIGYWVRVCWDDGDGICSGVVRAIWIEDDALVSSAGARIPLAQITSIEALS